MQTHVGYIVQFQDDDDYCPYHGTMRLYRNFSQALLNAQELYRGYLDVHEEPYDGPFEVFNPTKKNCDDAGSVVVFRSRNFIVWIDLLIE